MGSNVFGANPRWDVLILEGYSEADAFQMVNDPASIFDNTYEPRTVFIGCCIAKEWALVQEAQRAGVPLAYKEVEQAFLALPGELVRQGKVKRVRRQARAPRTGWCSDQFDIVGHLSAHPRTVAAAALALFAVAQGTVEEHAEEDHYLAIAYSFFRTAQEMLQSARDTHSELYQNVLSWLAEIAIKTSQAEVARAYIQEIRALAGKDLNLQAEAVTLDASIAAAYADANTFRRLQQEAMRLYTQAHRKDRAAMAVFSLAVLAAQEGNYTEAIELVERSIPLFREEKHWGGLSTSYMFLANLTQTQGDTTLATQHLRMAQRHAAEAGEFGHALQLEVSLRTIEAEGWTTDPTDSFHVPGWGALK